MGKRNVQVAQNFLQIEVALDRVSWIRIIHFRSRNWGELFALVNALKVFHEVSIGI